MTAFGVLAKKQIGLLKEPSLSCVRFVVKEVQGIAGNSLAGQQGNIARLQETAQRTSLTLEWISEKVAGI